MDLSASFDLQRTTHHHFDLKRMQATSLMKSDCLGATLARILDRLAATSDRLGATLAILDPHAVELEVQVVLEVQAHSEPSMVVSSWEQPGS